MKSDTFTLVGVRKRRRGLWGLVRGKGEGEGHRASLSGRFALFGAIEQPVSGVVLSPVV